jgi:hypothetical protein
MRSAILLFLLLCSVAFHGQKPFIDWDKLNNPVFSNEEWSVKDASMIYVEETEEFFLFFSAFFWVGDRVNSHVVSVKTKDWVNFSEPLFIWGGDDLGYYGLCSPEIHFYNDKYVLTYNGWGDKKGKLNQLYYAVSEDMEHWEKHQPLGREITKEYRAIDAALAFYDETYYLFFKDSKPLGHLPRVDLTRVASAKELDGPWEFVYSGYATFIPQDTLDADKIYENFMLLQIDNVWYMQNSGYWPHNPYLYKIGGDPSEKGWWTVWEDGRRLDIPVQKGFNTAHQANAAHLKDWRKYDGYFYLIYAGNTENESFWTRGHNKLGLARSKDLINWEVPPVR